MLVQGEMARVFFYFFRPGGECQCKKFGSRFFFVSLRREREKEREEKEREERRKRGRERGERREGEKRRERGGSEEREEATAVFRC